MGFKLCPKDELEDKGRLGRMKSELYKPCQEHTFFCVERN